MNKEDVVEIRGYSNTKEKIKNYEGYWLKVSIENNDGYYSDGNGDYGWIFSQYVDVDPNVNVSTLKVIKSGARTELNEKYLTLEIDRNGSKIETDVVPDKLSNQPFYTFVWSDDMYDFIYSDPVGTFKWNPETNEIQNITNMGSTTGYAWCSVTDDYKFLLQDYGTCPCPRGIGVFDIETNKQVFLGTYCFDLDYDGDNNITIVEVYDPMNAKNNYIEEKSVTYAEKFINDIPMSGKDLEWKDKRCDVYVIVKYRFNLISKERKYIGCDYIHGQ